MKSIDRVLKVFVTSMERHTGWYLAGLSALYLVFTGLIAATKPMWYDELVTYYICQLSFPGMWKVLKAGIDFNPPLGYIAGHGSLALLGDNAFAIRMPSMIGFWMMALCVFFFLRRRVGTLFAFSGMLLLLLSTVYRYAVEARPYGLVLGGAGLALVCWQAAAESRRRGLALAGISLGLLMALSSHCYAVLLALPLGAGEIVRSIRHKRIDWSVWLAFAAATPPVFLYPYFMSGRGLYILNNPVFQRFSIKGFYDWLLQLSMLPVLLAFIVIALLAVWPRDDRRNSITIPIHEVAAMFGLVCIPLMGMLLGRVYTGIFEYRYAVSASIGITALFTWVICRATQQSKVAAALIVVLFAGTFLNRQRGTGALSAIRRELGKGASKDAATEEASIPEHPMLALASKQDLPLVVSSNLWFLELDHYAPPSLLSRMYFLTDRSAALQYTGTDDYDVVFPLMQKWFPIRAQIQDYEQFSASHPRFLLYAPAAYGLEWLVEKLIADGAGMQLLALDGDRVLLEVGPRDSADRPSAQAKVLDRK